MIRLLYIVGVCVLSAACAVLGLWLGQRGRSDPRLVAILTTEIGNQRSEVSGQKSEVAEQSVPALVAQAQAFAAILDPPPAAKPIGAPVVASDTLPLLTTKTRPAMPSISFKLVATSYYAGRPDKSMALLAEPGNKDGGRWVKEGAQIGHFTVHEIKQGVVVHRDKNGKWKAGIRVGGRQTFIGLFDDEVEAARAYDRKAREMFGEFAYLNFPDGGRIVRLTGRIYVHSYVRGQVREFKSESTKFEISNGTGSSMGVWGIGVFGFW
jgi:hypothetical protein